MVESSRKLLKTTFFLELRVKAIEQLFNVKEPDIAA
jgi:hypothetical protein